jgi:hypothetical protein
MLRLVPLVVLFSMLVSCEKNTDDPTPVDSSTLNNGLLLYLPFSGNLGDSSGKANHGTGFGTVAYQENKYFEGGQALQLNGTTNRVEIPGQLFEGLTKFTMYMEFNPSSSAEMVLLSKTSYAVPASGIMNQSFNIIVNHAQGGNRFNMKLAGHCNDQNTATAFGPATLGNATPLVNAWNYLAVTYDGSSVKTYMNGHLVAQGSIAAAVICGGGSPLQIGAWWQGYGSQFQGRIDEVRIYDRVLTQPELTAIYKID